MCVHLTCPSSHHHVWPTAVNISLTLVCFTILCCRIHSASWSRPCMPVMHCTFFIYQWRVHACAPWFSLSIRLAVQEVLDITPSSVFTWRCHFCLWPVHHDCGQHASFCLLIWNSVGLSAFLFTVSAETTGQSSVMLLVFWLLQQLSCFSLFESCLLTTGT